MTSARSHPLGRDGARAGILLPSRPALPVSFHVPRSVRQDFSRGLSQLGAHANAPLVADLQARLAELTALAREAGIL